MIRFSRRWPERAGWRTAVSVGLGTGCFETGRRISGCKGLAVGAGKAGLCVCVGEMGIWDWQEDFG